MFDRIMCVLVRIKGTPCDVYHTVHESHKCAFLDISRVGREVGFLLEPLHNFFKHFFLFIYLFKIVN